MNHSRKWWLKLSFYTDNRVIKSCIFFFQSSLDRGCFSCECLLIPENTEGIAFWKKRLGNERIEDLLRNQGQNKPEIIIELSKTDMNTFYQQTDLHQLEQQQQQQSQPT